MQTSILVGPGRTYVDSLAEASEYSYAVLKMIIVLMRQKTIAAMPTSCWKMEEAPAGALQSTFKTYIINSSLVQLHVLSGSMMGDLAETQY